MASSLHFPAEEIIAPLSSLEAVHLKHGRQEYSSILAVRLAVLQLESFLENDQMRLRGFTCLV